jgi:cellobiose-specific phosphotransferase system component IIA
MGYIMGAGHYKQKIVEALKANDNHEALSLWVHQQQNGVDVTSDPLFFLTKAIVHLRNGNADAANLKLNKALELLGK